MALKPGMRLGPYEIVAPLGAGGMGEVYKVRDVRLNRIVAIKVLPDHLKQDADRRQRFLQEALTVAALDHPHICVLHDVGTEGGVDFLVMEYLEGETLAERLAKGPLAPDEMLRHTIEIGSALDKAHRQGVVHRDLKPGNVMLTKAGVKLLDFGLAKLRPPAGMATSSMTSAITAAPLTGEGTFFGTLPYMAPEQLEGRDIDARTDIFAFGVVMYEMATGARAFEGTSQAGVIAAILEHRPQSIRTLQPAMPRALDHIVVRCLAKDPEERWQNAADLTFALATARQDLRETDSREPGLGAPRRSRAGFVVAMTIVAALAGLAFVLWARPTTTGGDRSLVTLFLAQRPLAALTENGPLPALAISRDGQHVVFVGEQEGRRRLLHRRMDIDQLTILQGTDGAIAPFFSPDGSRVGFFADGRLKTVALGGGAPTVLADTVNGRGATWASDDTIIYSPGTDAGLWRVPSTGGTPQQLMAPDPDKGERSYRWPAVLPGNETVVFTLATSQILSFDDARIVSRSLRTGEQRELVRGGSFPIFVEPDLLLYTRAGALLAVPFDPIRLEITAPATTVLDNVTTYPLNGGAQYALAANGSLVYAAGGSSTREAVLTWFDRTGASNRLNVAPLPYNRVSLSRNAQRVALDIDGANASIWIVDLPQSAEAAAPLPMTRLTLEWSNNLPFWMPDGEHVGFVSARGGIRTLFRQSIDGRSPPERLVKDHESDIIGASVSPDGHTVIYEERHQATGSDLMIATVGEGTPRPFLRTPVNEQAPQFSPDGRWVAYVSDESGREEVFIQPFPGPGRKSMVSIDGGIEPIWSAKGDELFYLNGDAVMVATVMNSQTSSFATGRPELLFRKRRAGSRGLSYAVAPDGRFLMIEDLPARHSSTLVTVVLNWLDDAKRRLPRH